MFKAFQQPGFFLPRRDLRFGRGDQAAGNCVFPALLGLVELALLQSFLGLGKEIAIMQLFGRHSQMFGELVERLPNVGFMGLQSGIALVDV